MVVTTKSIRYKIHTILIGILLIIFTRFAYCSEVYSKEENKNVLFISSYNESFITLPDQISGIKEVFDENDINLDVEYMDTKRFTTKENEKVFYQMIEYKLKNLKPYDAIIVGDDSALQFAMDYQGDLFDGLPIVFLGINDFTRANLANENQYITGIIEETLLKDNIEIALKFNNKAKKVVAIVDNTITGIGDKNQFYYMKDRFKELTFEEIISSECTQEELGGQLEKLGDDTILLYLTMFEDKDGNKYTIDEAAKFLVKHTNIPIYRVSIGGIGQGILGGNMVSYIESGKIAAQMVVDILGGQSIKSIEMITKSPNQYIFDYKVIKKFNINKKLLPFGSTLVNNDISFYEQNKQLVISIFFIFFVLVTISLVLVFDNIRRRKTEKEIKKSHDRLLENHEILTDSEEELRAQYDTIQEHIDVIEMLNQKFEIAVESTKSAVWEINSITKEIIILGDIETIVEDKVNKNETVIEVINKVLTPLYRQQLIEEYEKCKNGEKNEIHIQLPIKKKDETIKWVLIRGKGFFDKRKRIVIHHGIVIDITKMKEQESRIERLAQHDYLTNLPNRMFYMEKLHEEIKKGRPGAVVLLDLDDFKRVNDTLGHAYGDKVLQEIAARLLEITDDKLFVSRFGGDEFIILIFDVPTRNHIKSYILKIRSVFQKPVIVNNIENYVNFSMGVSCFPEDGIDENKLIMNADTAMYKVKQSGKNSYIFYHSNMRDQLKDRIEIESILREAIATDGFTLVYQPQIDVNSGKIIGFEALLRLKKYNISPMVFIDIAEETGLILTIGRWVTREVVMQLANWKERGFNIKPVAINFSSKQLRDEDYFGFLVDLLSEHEIDTKYIEMEITESILLEQSDTTMSFLHQLKDIGIKIALDDFGTGYSSLNYLTFIPVNKIKLDKSLSDKFLGMENIKVMDSLISLAHSLDLKITAEGVEDQDQYKRLKKGGCNFIQGYYFSRPLKLEDVEAIYDKNFLTDI